MKIFISSLCALFILSGCFSENNSADRPPDNPVDQYLPSDTFIAQENAKKYLINPAAFEKPWITEELETIMKNLDYESVPLEKISSAAKAAAYYSIMYKISDRTVIFEEKRQDKYQTISCSLDDSKIRKGDIILSVTRNASCMAISGENSFHHSLLCVKTPTSNEDPVFIAITSSGDGKAKLYPLSETRNTEDFAVVLRVYNSDDALTDKAVSYALDQIGKDFNYSGDKNADDSFYCSQLIWRSYRYAGIDLDSNHDNFNDYGIVLPDEIFTSPYLYTITFSD